MSDIQENLFFEPHGMYGQKIDGEPFPFGYISGGKPVRPIFELMPPLVFSKSELTALATIMAAAPELLDALIAALPYVEEAEPDPAYARGSVAKVLKIMRSAIAKAEGKSNA